MRTALPPEQTASEFRTIMRSIDPSLAVAGMRTMAQLVSQASAGRRFQTAVLTGFGVISMFLSVLGLYGLMAYSVQERTAEIGIRMALGAHSGSVVSLILRQGMTLWLAGITLGSVCALVLTRWIRTLLFEVPPTDPVTFFAVGTLFCVVAAIACYVPARRATRIHPAISLRYE